LLFLLTCDSCDDEWWVVMEAGHGGRDPWRVRALVGAGVGLAGGGWMVLILLDRSGGETCYKPSEIVDGRIMPAEKIECNAAPVTVDEAIEPVETTDG